MGRYLKIPGVPILVFVVLTLTHNPNLNLMLSLLSPALSSGGGEGEEHGGAPSELLDSMAAGCWPGLV